MIVQDSHISFTNGYHTCDMCKHSTMRAHVRHPCSGDGGGYKRPRQSVSLGQQRVTTRSHHGERAAQPSAQDCQPKRPSHQEIHAQHGPVRMKTHNPVGLPCQPQSDTTSTGEKQRALPELQQPKREIGLGEGSEAMPACTWTSPDWLS